MSQTKRYVVLPAYGFRSSALAQMDKLQTVGPVVRLEMRAGARGRRAARGAATAMRVLHSTHENGPKLVEMTPEAELNLRAENPGLKVVPVVEYHKLNMQHRIERRAVMTASSRAAAEASLNIVDKDTANPLAGARVIAFTNFDRRVGAEAVSSKSGVARLKLAPGDKIERLYIYGPTGFWGHYATNAKLKSEESFGLKPIDLQDQGTLLPSFYGKVPATAGEGVRIAVIDTGVAERHPGLPNVGGGANLVFNEINGNIDATTEWGPARKDGAHGTHVAGIIGARATANAKVRGVAPGVELRSYRVFPHTGKGAQNYDIMNAIDRAVLDGCHIINLSLGGSDEDEAVRAAIGNALDNGVLVVAAAGNNGRRAVLYPAALPGCIAVSAMGRRGTYPRQSTEESDAAKPFGSVDKDAFIGAFSNVGPQIDVAGPGVGVVSTMPGDAYGVMSGTSMACPGVVGFAASLLASKQPIMNAGKGERVKLLQEALFATCRVQGFGRDFEGFGLPAG
ncbi:MAG: S8 family serine peptidase [Hyphomonadaceae bacterium]|jgi:subtilisin|nr:S8 family serine peptidase [Hyphomonadaceae bacterium]